MNSPSTATPLSTIEFVPLAALLMSLVALSVDAMLPALPVIGADLEVARTNDAQLVVTALFIGLGIGQLVFGPLSDSIGRKPAIIAGLTVFMIGSLVSAFATTFETMIVGRILQGIGASGPRSVTMALVRDQFSGKQMARIVSFIMAVFILVPAIAPAIGQVILWFGDWRSIFGTFFATAAAVLVWFTVRQPETLKSDYRRILSARSIGEAIADFCRTRSTMIYTLAMGLVFAPFVGYLSSAQQIFQEAYSTGTLFPLYFGVLALAVGCGLVMNDRLLRRHGMHPIAQIATTAATVLSFAALTAFAVFDGLPPFWLFMAYMLALFACLGPIFGNLNALAMEPLGHIAGVGAALISSIATLISVIVGTAIGQQFDGTVLFQVGSFAVFGLSTMLCLHWAIRSR